MKNNSFEKALGAGLVFFIAYCIYHLLTTSDQSQWDFLVNYHAARVFFDGFNPYDANILKSTAGVALPYVYPPVILWFYGLFTLVEYHAAYILFLFFKIGMIGGLILLWRRKFIAAQAGIGFYFFCLLAFNSAMYIDLSAGNINMLEQLLLWLGLYFFLTGSPLLFCGFILLSSAFKITPLAFLGLLIFTDHPKKYFYLAGSGLAFGVYLLIQYVWMPDLFLNFLEAARGTIFEDGMYTPSTFGFIGDALTALAKSTGLSIPEAVRPGIYALVVALVVGISGHAYVTLKSLKTEDQKKILLFLFCLVYALLHPRLKDYGCVLLIVPAYYIIKTTSYSKVYPLLFALVVLSAMNVTLPGLEILYTFLWNYYPLAVTYLIWMLYLYEIYSLCRRQEGGHPSDQRGGQRIIGSR